MKTAHGKNWFKAGAMLVVLALMVWLVRGVARDRHLGCNEQSGRAQEICAALQRHLHWSWTGHGFIAPGSRADFATVRGAWCDLHLQPDDITALEQLGRAPDARLRSGTGWLLTLLHNRQAKPEDYHEFMCAAGGPCHPLTLDNNSVFHPQSPYYLLRNDCTR